MCFQLCDLLLVLHAKSKAKKIKIISDIIRGDLHISEKGPMWDFGCRPSDADQHHLKGMNSLARLRFLLLYYLSRHLDVKLFPASSCSFRVRARMFLLQVYLLLSCFQQSITHTLSLFRKMKLSRDVGMQYLLLLGFYIPVYW